MTSQEQFTDEEWMKVVALPGLVLFGAGTSDGHLLPAIRELKAGGEALTAGLERYPENMILQAFTAESPKREDEAQEKDAASSEEDGEGGLEAIVAGIQAGVDVLRVRVTVQEFEQIGEVLTALARSVTERLGAGFMGSGDEKVSPDEQAFVDRVASMFTIL